MTNYKNQIKQAKTSMEVSCVMEDIRNAFFNKKSISREAYDKRINEAIQRRKEIYKKGM